MRERGLKFLEMVHKSGHTISRSREGAWIEILSTACSPKKANGRSREGAWIEIHGLKTTFDSGYVAPVRERGLKSLKSGNLERR